MSGGRLRFVGCGPGAPDLLTLRAVRALEAADVVIWNASLLERRALVERVRGDAEIVEWPPATADDILRVLDRAAEDGLLVVRLKGGDPTLFGSLEPERSAARARGLTCDIVPGVSALGAGAAALGLEVADPGTSLLLVGSRMLCAEPEVSCAIAIHGAIRDPRAVQRALLDRGLAVSAACVVMIEVSRRDEMIVRCPLGELAETLEDLGRGVMTLVLAGS